MAQMHIMPKNGTDTLLLRAIIAIILENGWEDKEYIAKYASGWEKGRKWFENFDHDAALIVCRVPKKQIMEFVRILCTKKWGVHADLGLFFGRHASLSVYLLNVLMVITGNFLVPGTNTIANDYLSWGKFSDENTPETWRTWKTNGFPTISMYGGNALQECMEDPDENNRMRALFVEAGNPARSWPDSEALIRDFKNLDLMVVIDIAMTETALLNSIEGLRAEPRLKPPFPTVKGAFGKPTVVNNVETFANVPMIVENGAAWFTGIGNEAYPGTKIFSVSGDIKKPGCYEVSTDVTLDDIVNGLAGGVSADKVSYYPSVQESFAVIAEDFFRILGGEKKNLKTAVFTANNENGAQAAAACARSCFRRDLSLDC